MPALLFVAFLVVPLAELAVIVQVEGVIGLGWTLLALIAISLAGAALVKREGLRAWTRLRAALAEGRLPAAEVVDGALLLFAGALLLTPGFLTDTVGLLLLFPLTRTGVNRALRGRVRRSFGLAGPAQPERGRGRRQRAPGGRPAARAPDTLDVEVVDVRRTDDEPPGAAPS